MTDKKDIQEFAPAVVPVATTAARFGAGQMLKAGAAAAGAAAAFSPKVKRFVSHSLGLDKTPEQSAASLDKAAEKLGIKTSSPSTPAASTPAAGGSPTTPAEKDTPKPVETTKAVDKPVNVVKTKGGDYNVYAKDSEKAADFRKTYSAAKGNFEWEGRKYAKPSSEVNNTNTTQTKPESESGGKKKMSEETNPLIAAFLKLQSENPSNMFEAAKRAKKDYDKDGKIESPKDEVWGSRFRAAKMAGKMEEGEQLDEVGDTARGQKKLARVYKRAVDRTMTATEPFFKHGKMSDSDKETVKKLRDVKDRAWERMSEGAGEETAKKEVEEIDEVSAGLARRAAHHAFVKSDKMKADAKKEPDMHSYVQAFHKGENKSKQGVKFANYAAKKMKEEVEEVELDELSKDTLKSYVDKAKKDVYFLHGDPKRSETKIRKQRRAGIKAAKEKLANEEVEFSQAEIDHINSFFEQVAPGRPEPTKGVNPTVSNTSLTDETIEEGRPKKNPEPASTDRDPRKHIQVEAGRAAAGSVVDFHHNDGSKSKITPAMGRRITSHLQGLKPAERQAAVNKMHASAEGLKV